MQLRPYQNEAVAAVKSSWKCYDDVLLVAATGAGKTQIFLSLVIDEAKRTGGRILVLAHRRELISQPIERIGQTDPDWLADSFEPRVGVIMAERNDTQCQLTIATVQSLTARGKQAREEGRYPRIEALLAAGPIDYFIIDECFPAGTRIDGRAIDTLRVGDLVRSYNHTLARMEMRPITRLFRKPVQRLVRVTLDTGQQIVCTPNHPFYTQNGYVAAERLAPYHIVRLVVQERMYDQAEGVCSVRSDLSTAQLDGEDGSDMFGGVQTGTPRGAAQGCNTAVYRVREDRRMQRDERTKSGAQRTGVLLGRMPQRVFEPDLIRSHGKNQSQVCLTSYDRTQPDEARGYPREGIGNAARYEAHAQKARRQRQAGANTTADVSRSTTMADGSYRAYSCSEGQCTSTANALQVGYCEPRIDDRYRGRWAIACGIEAEGTRRQEDNVSAFARVASVQVLERGSDDRFGGLCPDGFVYNIEVAGNHNYYAEGVLVHNCHHGVSQSYVTVLEELKKANPNLKHLGVTATPIRGDGNGLKSVYQHTAMVISIADLVKMHYLVQPRWLGIKTNISLKGVATSGSDFSASDLADRFDTPAGRRVIVESFLKYTSDRKAVAFTASVKGAHELAAAFNAVGISAATVDGTTEKALRAQILADFAAGRYQILANCAVLTEGWDCPSVTAVLMCRPTKSDGLYVQCMGRGLRPANGTADPGEDCIILDFLPEETRNIVMAGDVLGLPKETTRTVLKEQDEETEEGFVQAGFTFDGEHFDSSGTPLEIVARQLDYLQASRWQWDRRDGWMTLGLGPGEDGADRVMAIAPTEQGHTLYGLRRDPVGEDDNGKAKYGKWYLIFERFGEVDRLCEAAEKLADKYAAGALAGKGRSWHKNPASPAAVAYLRRLMPKGTRLPGYLSSIECSSLISYWQIRNTLSATSRTV